jgi:formate/nitrite transporter FocA (FNT family)
VATPARGGWSLDMDYAKPADVVASMIDASLKKLALSPRDLLIRGAISGALLGAATSLAFGAAVTTGQPLVGAIVFPVGFVMIVLLGLELVTGSFALLPLARWRASRVGTLSPQTGRGCFSETCLAAWSMADCWRSP